MPDTVNQIAKRLDEYNQDAKSSDALLIKVSTTLDNFVIEMRQSREDNQKKFDDLHKGVDRINKILNGNGVLGLIANVVKLDERVKNEEGRNKDTRDVFWKILAFAGMTFTIILSIFTKF